ncbi:MAG: energy transducer TonB [Cyclobacteriaceae bacterium]|nr:energy transducer TonB [Cyclobacteriaceae bacterium]
MEAKKNPKQDLQRQSFKFFLIGLSISVALTITAFEWQTKKKETVSPTFDTSPEAMFEIKATEPKALPIIPTPATIKKNINSITKSDTRTTFIETNDIKEVRDELPSIKSIDFVPFGTDIPAEETPIIFISPEIMPVPMGGYKSFYEQLSKSIKYPRQAQRNQVQGKVFVEFIIDQHGNVTDLKIAKGIGYGCDEEAMRVLLQTQWKPGKQRGIPVKVRMTLPLYFKLN